MVSRLIEGEYFRIDQMLSSDYETKISINKKEFLDCIDRATLLVREGEKKPIIIEISDNTIKVIDDETIRIYLVNPKAPCFIRDDDENYTYLILPVNINQNQTR